MSVPYDNATEERPNRQTGVQSIVLVAVALIAFGLGTLIGRSDEPKRAAPGRRGTCDHR
jgi:hypothetical protein